MPIYDCIGIVFRYWLIKPSRHLCRVTSMCQFSLCCIVSWYTCYLQYTIVYLLLVVSSLILDPRVSRSFHIISSICTNFTLGNWGIWHNFADQSPDHISVGSAPKKSSTSSRGRHRNFSSSTCKDFLRKFVDSELVDMTPQYVIKCKKYRLVNQKDWPQLLTSETSKHAKVCSFWSSSTLAWIGGLRKCIWLYYELR